MQNDPVSVSLPISVAALYRFTPFADPVAIQQMLRQSCAHLAVKGTLILAQEGINGTVAGSDEAIATLLGTIKTLPGCQDIEVKFSRAASMPFQRMKVKVKREIVTMGQPHIDPLASVGTYVAPEDWNALIDRPDVLLIDTRNVYEIEQGTFNGAVDPGTQHFREFPAWFEAEKARLLAEGQSPKIAMFCTGGIRCEKATAFVKGQGFDEVYHLQGGILKYLEQVPEDESRWHGQCFVFDERETVGQGLAPGNPAPSIKGAD